jgi:hypothetical protein
MLPLINSVSKEVQLVFGTAEILVVNDIITRVIDIKLEPLSNRNYFTRVVDHELFRFLERLPRTKRRVYNRNMICINKEKNVFKFFGDMRSPVHISLKYVSVPQNMPLDQDLSFYSTRLLTDIIKFTAEKFLAEQSR